MHVNIYLGKQYESAKKETEIGKKAVLALCEPYFGTNFFSSIPLCKELWSKKIMYIGTMRSNKLDIPESFLKHKSRPVGSSLFAFKEYLTLTSFVPKEKKAVILISTKHHSDEVDFLTKKPEIILEYNKLKGIIAYRNRHTCNSSNLFF